MQPKLEIKDLGDSVLWGFLDEERSLSSERDTETESAREGGVAALPYHHPRPLDDFGDSVLGSLSPVVCAKTSRIRRR